MRRPKRPRPKRPAPKRLASSARLAEASARARRWGASRNEALARGAQALAAAGEEALREPCCRAAGADAGAAAPAVVPAAQ
mmetsp:Transcript_21661/g.77162  ORF Transcript_21661/g.77162 Transcript_21661/m.77162 type:complete len:81 (+) Transcript_21661:273-515(+)